MARTDDLIRNRLDRKREAEEIYRQNQERLLKSQKTFVERPRGGQGIICGREQGWSSFGVPDGRNASPLRAAHSFEITSPTNKENNGNLEYNYLEIDRSMRK